jgi:hypothetical protein
MADIPSAHYMTYCCYMLKFFCTIANVHTALHLSPCAITSHVATVQAAVQRLDILQLAQLQPEQASAVITGMGTAQQAIHVNFCTLMILHLMGQLQACGDHCCK